MRAHTAADTGRRARPLTHAQVCTHVYPHTQLLTLLVEFFLLIAPLAIVMVKRDECTLTGI